MELLTVSHFTVFLKLLSLLIRADGCKKSLRGPLLMPWKTLGGPVTLLVPANLLLKEVIYIRDKKKLRDFLDHAQMKQLGNIYYNVDNFSCGFPDHLESTKNLIEIKFGIGFFLHFIISVCKIIMVMISLFVSS